MKYITIILFASILYTGSVFGQSKKEVQYQAAQFEKLLNQEKKAHKVTLDSLKRYIIMYDAIREKVLPYDFKPENTSAIIDSLQMDRDSTLMDITGKSFDLTGQIDSLTLKIDSQQVEIDKLLQRIKMLQKPMAEVTDEQIAELKKIKELMDSGILTEEEFTDRKKGILKNE